MIFKNDNHFAWTSLRFQEERLYFKGCKETALNVLKCFKNASATEVKTSIVKQLKMSENLSSGVIENSSTLIAWVDHIRSWPLYYTLTAQQALYLSPSAEHILSNLDTNTVDIDASLEFAMAGYVTGSATLYKDMSCLQAGEILIWNKKEKQLELGRHFQYVPSFEREETKEILTQELSTIIDEIFIKIIKKANGRPIWIPLSGGLDSRLILCKFHQLNYKNLHTFTYGPALNFEAKIAKKIARKLGVPWHFIRSPQSKRRQNFWSHKRKTFWQFACGHKSIPSMGDYEVLLYLREKNLLPDDAIIINGQSGDFITGGHISKKWLNSNYHTQEVFFDNIISKHYALWRPLMTKKNRAIIKHKISTLLGGMDFKTTDTVYMARCEEAWEYEARQICFVVHGNRYYDFCGYDWELPLWDKKLVNFFMDISLHEKLEQNLFKNYLKDYNYCGLFPEKEAYIWRWPLQFLWVIPIAKLTEIIFGKQAKENFYQLMRYFGHYSDQYCVYNWSIYKESAIDARNIFSFYVRTWIEEHPECFGSIIKKAIKL